MTWPTKKLGEVCKIMGGGTPSTGNQEYWGNEHYWATPRDLAGIYLTDINSTSRAISAFGLEHSSAELLPIGSVILSTRAPIGHVAINSVPMAINQGCRAFICSDELLNRYLYYFLVLSKKYLQSLGRGATFGEINKATLEKIEIPVPAVGVQEKIVERLDAIQEAQKLNNELIQKTDELFSSLLYSELNPKGKHWETKKLEEFVQFNPKKQEIAAVESGTEVGFLAMADVSDNAEILRIQKRKLKEVVKGYTFFKDGDILFAKITPCMENGKGAFVENMPNGIGFGSTEFHVLRVDQEVAEPRLFHYFLSKKSFRQKAKQYMTGSAGQQRLPDKYLKNLKIPLPSLEIQKEIVEKLNAAQEYKKGLLEQKAKLQELFDSVLHRSMKGEMVE